MGAELVSSAFLGEQSAIGATSWSDSLSLLAQQIDLPEILVGTGCVRFDILAIPSFRTQINTGQSDLYSAVPEQEERAILQGLGLEESGFPIISICRGGASVAAALSSAADIVHRERNKSVIIVGAEAISKQSGLKTMDLVVNAGKSVFPKEAIGNTLVEEVHPTLITAYALRESAILEGIDSPQVLRTGRNDSLSRPLSGEIHPEEVAASSDGSFLAVVAPSKQDGDPSRVYIALGNITPKTGNHVLWWEMPGRFNMALEPVQRILRSAELDHSRVHAELYECFFVAVVQQTAALLNIDSINKETIGTIYAYINEYKPVSHLREWAAWGISSAEKAFLIWKTLHEKQYINGKNSALLISNGGVMNEIAAVLLTADMNLSRLSSFEELRPTLDIYELVVDKNELVGKKGNIDMVAYQRPIVRGDGSIIQRGSTFVRVVLEGNKVVLTNLALAGKGDSLFDDLTSKGKISTEVELGDVNGKNSPIAAICK